MKIAKSNASLAELWATLTAVPLAEARYRVRALREAGCLPDSRVQRRPLTDIEVATFILGAVGSDSHLHAAERAQAYAQLLPRPGSIIGNQLALSVSRATLVDALAAILRRVRDGTPQVAVSLTVSTSHTKAELVITDAEGTAALLYGSPANDADGAPWPLRREVELPGPVLGRMAALLGMLPETVARKIAAYEQKLEKQHNGNSLYDDARANCRR